MRHCFRRRFFSLFGGSEAGPDEACSGTVDTKLDSAWLARSGCGGSLWKYHVARLAALRKRLMDVSGHSGCMAAFVGTAATLIKPSCSCKARMSDSVLHNSQRSGAARVVSKPANARRMAAKEATARNRDRACRDIMKSLWLRMCKPIRTAPIIKVGESNPSYIPKQGFGPSSDF